MASKMSRATFNLLALASFALTEGSRHVRQYFILVVVFFVVFMLSVNEFSLFTREVRFQLCYRLQPLGQTLV